MVKNMGGCAMKVSFICEEKLKEKIGGLFLSSLLSMSTEIEFCCSGGDSEELPPKHSGFVLNWKQYFKV
jgi:hypothetical protein